MDTEPEPPALLAADVTPADVGAISAFLLPRIERQLLAHRPGSPEWRFAYALESLLGEAARTVRRHLELLADGDGRDEPGRADSLRAVRAGWNRLWEIVHPWQGDEAYDEARWQPIDHLDAAER
ncbi:hypothetical protein [Kitasatospora sp. NPDC057223]|uniref:hypothetical protein n=1 Tax=Kitasatospora sp. NPDC057223 TaxID=3346055 RepID=UPI00364404C1